MQPRIDIVLRSCHTNEHSRTSDHPHGQWSLVRHVRGRRAAPATTHVVSQRDGVSASTSTALNRQPSTATGCRLKAGAGAGAAR